MSISSLLLFALIIVAGLVAAGAGQTPSRKRAVAAALIGLAVALAAAWLAQGRAGAQTPDAVALGIERKLLCPQCTNQRLDVCDTQICVDMRAAIRERLARGESEQEIIDYFTGRYGQRVLAEVPRRGFNLVLFGWVGASLALVAAVGALVLVRLRRSARAGEAAGALDAQTERWLDEEIAGGAAERDTP